MGPREQRANEDRVGLTPEGAKALIDAGADMAPKNSWPDAPLDAIIIGLKELSEDGTPLPHKHIMFGHAFKG